MVLVSLVLIDILLVLVCGPAILDFQFQKHNCLLRNVSVGSLVYLNVSQRM